MNGMFRAAGTVASVLPAARALDPTVGRILTTLDHQGLRNDTIVVFTSDDGAVVGGGT